MPETWTVHCDGSAVPNPGRMGVGAVIVAPDGSRRLLSQALPGTGCNNEAELRSLMAALELLRQEGAASLCIHTDSSILVEQLSGTAHKPIVRLAPLFDQARALLATFGNVELRWIPQHRNGEADALARAALGMAPRAPRKPQRRR